MKTRLSGWARSVLAGSLIITLAASPGIALLLVTGKVVAALKVLLTCVVSGGVAGLAHGAASPLCNRGRLGSSLYGVLVVEVYFLTALGCIFLISEFWAPEPMFSEVPTQFLLPAALVMGIPFGVAWGENRWKHTQRPGGGEA